ncbi:MAG: hypothetical protein V2J89_09920 [Halieaceae bacterium]|nr:hypothetical protein [Halieaceae bacterium]
MKFALTPMFLAVSLAAPAVFANCDVPESPVLPDGTTASLAEMVEGQQAVKAYMEAAEAYLACLVAEETAAGQEESDALRSARNDAHNGAVETMERLADAFNAEVRAYKAQAK